MNTNIASKQTTTTTTTTSSTRRAEATLAALSFCSAEDDDNHDSLFSKENENDRPVSSGSKDVQEKPQIETSPLSTNATVTAAPSRRSTDISCHSHSSSTANDYTNHSPTRKSFDSSSSFSMVTTTDDGNDTKEEEEEEKDRSESSSSSSKGLAHMDNDTPDNFVSIPDWVEDDENLDSRSGLCHTKDTCRMEDDSPTHNTSESSPVQQLHFFSPPTTTQTQTQPLLLSMLEDLSPDISAMILHHLSVQDIANVALVSRTMSHHAVTDELWKRKFQGRWNGTYPIHKNWLHCYQEAYRNPHDLWITHWNCLYPDEGDAPGRCCIPDTIPGDPKEEDHLTTTTTTIQQPQPQPQQQHGGNDDDHGHQHDDDNHYQSCWMNQCPTCRYQSQSYDLPVVVHAAMAKDRLYYNGCQEKKKESSDDYSLQQQQQEDDDDDPIDEAEISATAHALLLQDDRVPTTTTTTTSLLPLSSRAKHIFAMTQYSIAKFCRHVQTIHQLSYKPQKISVSKRLERARQAFQSASTFHRQIRPEQYKSSGLYFLDDTLFFNIGESRLTGSKKGRTELNHLRQDVYGCDVKEEEEENHDDHNDDNDDVDVSHDTTTIQPNNLPNSDQNRRPTTTTTTTRGSPSSTSASVSHVGHQVEVSHHTWHVVRFTNPDYVRPITFRIYVQRPDCFTVYPSEGYLEAGESCQIVLGVRPPGSLLNEAFETLDVHREEVDPFLADVYSKEAHLPFAPYAIRYMFAPTIPCIPPFFTSRGGIRPSQTFVRPTWTQAASSKYKDVVEYLWDNVATETNVRTKYLSAHVNSNYNFDEFQLATLFPFDINVCHSDDWGRRREDHDDVTAGSLLEPHVFVAPNLLQNDCETFQKLQNIQLETELSDAGIAFRTEKNCAVCRRDWGYRSEELGRAYILRKLVCDFRERKRHQQMKNVITCLRHLTPFIFSSIQDAATAPIQMDQIHQIIFALHTLLVQRRAARASLANTSLLSTAQQTILVQLELLVDQCCVKIHTHASEKMRSHVLEKGENAEKDANELLFVDHLSLPPRILHGREWKNAGVYRHVRCTDSVFGKVLHSESVERSMISNTRVLLPSVSWKQEPEYLDGFRHLWHNPGFYCIGKQEDPNHDDDEEIYNEESSFALSKRFHRSKWERNTDVYMDNAVLGFASALSMIADPRSLLVHGVYDRSPESIVRRPMMPEPMFWRTLPMKPHDRKEIVNRAMILAAKWKKSTNYSMQQHEILRDKQDKETNYPIYLRTVDLDYEIHSFLGQSNNKKDHDDNSVPRNMSSLERFVKNIPPPGVGKFSLTSQRFTSHGEAEPELVPLSVVMNSGVSEILPLPPSSERGVENDGNGIIGANQQQNRVREGNDRIGNRNVRGPRILRFLWLLSATMGWSVDESGGPGSILVDRRILIASQWVSNSLAAWPLIATLLARSLLSITPKPMDYHLEGLPFEIHNEMRYLTGRECAFAALVVTFLWLYLGRYSERSIGRSFERTMMEHFSMSNTDYPNGITSRFNIWCQRQWDRVCPLFMQRLVFTPRWNRRSRRDLLNHIAFWRNKDFREHRSTFLAEACLGGMTFGSGCQADGAPIEIREESATKKIVIGILISLGSFCVCSPHFLLNLMTVFCCSIALGLSMSLQSMETGRGISRATETRSILKPFGLNTLVIGFFLVGQLVGSSGGVLFLAEFVVTSMSLVLGGAGTISAAAMESWVCFFCLSSTAFWGYVFARVAIMDGMQTKRRGATSLILCISVLLVLGLGAGALFFWQWEMPPALMILRSSISKDRRGDRKYLAQQLQ